MTDNDMSEAEREDFRRRYERMSPLEAKLELLRQSIRLGYVGEESLGLQRLFNTIDAYIAGTRGDWDKASLVTFESCSFAPTTSRRNRTEPAGLPANQIGDQNHD